MVGVEKALKDSLDIYKRSPVILMPHFVEMILSLAVFLSIILTVVLAVGVKFTDLPIDDPALMMSELFSSAGLLVIIILTFLIGFFFLYLVKAGALAAVVAMAKQGFEGGDVTLRLGWEETKKHFLNIFLYWIFLGLLFLVIYALALLPAVLAALVGVSESIAVLITVLFFLLAFMVSIISYGALMFAPQLIVVNEIGPYRSLSESVDFVKNNIGAVAVYIAVAVVFNILLIGFFTLLSFVPDIITSFNEFMGTALNIFIFLIQLIVGLLIAPYFEMVKTHMILQTKKAGQI